MATNNSTMSVSNSASDSRHSVAIYRGQTVSVTTLVNKEIKLTRHDLIELVQVTIESRNSNGTTQAVPIIIIIIIILIIDITGRKKPLVNPTFVFNFSC